MVYGSLVSLAKWNGSVCVGSVDEDLKWLCVVDLSVARDNVACARSTG